MRIDQKITGELTITGKNKLEIKLDHGAPKNVMVGYKSIYLNASCNPHHDRLYWYTEQTHNGFILVIDWHVSDAKEIVWEFTI